MEEIKDWLDDGDWSSRSRINYLTKISQPYLWTLHANHTTRDANEMSAGAGEASQARHQSVPTGDVRFANRGLGYEPSESFA